MGVILEKCLSCIRRIARNVPQAFARRWESLTLRSLSTCTKWPWCVAWLAGLNLARTDVAP
jgi:hypothetical protein